MNRGVNVVLVVEVDVVVVTAGLVVIVVLVVVVVFVVTVVLLVVVVEVGVQNCKPLRRQRRSVRRRHAPADFPVEVTHAVMALSHCSRH